MNNELKKLYKTLEKYTNFRLLKLGPNQKAWLKELRSGKYRQEQGYLCRKDEETGEYGFCCLGVACELLYNRGEMKYKEVDSSPFDGEKIISYKIPRSKEDFEQTVLPNRAGEKFGLRTTDGEPAGIWNILKVNGNLTDEQSDRVEDVIEEFSDILPVTPLIELNDNGHPFDEIADILENYPNFYFNKSV